MFGSKKKIGHTNFLGQIFFGGQKKVLGQKMLSKKIFGLKKIWVKKNLAQKHFG